MIIDCRTWCNKTEEQIQAERHKVLVDGVEIHHVFYLDTDEGLVKTYDILGDGKPHSTLEKSLIPQPEWTSEDVPGAFYKIVRGVITLLPWEDNDAS